MFWNYDRNFIILQNVSKNNNFDRKLNFKLWNKEKRLQFWNFCNFEIFEHEQISLIREQFLNLNVFKEDIRNEF